METREAMAEHGNVWADTISRIVPRENNLDEKPVGGTTTIPIVLEMFMPAPKLHQTPDKMLLCLFHWASCTSTSARATILMVSVLQSN